jgi:flagellar hook-basal body complex protein FliE
MAIDFETAVNAYRQAASTVESAITNGTGAAPASGDNFVVNMVTDSLKGAVQTDRAAEGPPLKQIACEADLKGVVTAGANAEHTLETVIAVRDKVLTACQDILRMPI